LGNANLAEKKRRCMPKVCAINVTKNSGSLSSWSAKDVGEKSIIMPRAIAPLALISYSIMIRLRPITIEKTIT